MSNQEDPRTFISRKVSEGSKDPEQITYLESKPQREMYRFLTIYGMMLDPDDPTKSAFPEINFIRDYEQRMNMSKGEMPKVRSEQLVQAIVGLETMEAQKKGAKELAEELKKVG